MQFKNKYNGFAKAGLLISGLVLGILLSITYSAVAEKMVRPQMPIEDLRAFAEIFGKIKSDYVEPVEDKKLINEAITGMLTGLDPHSTYMDPEQFKDMQASTQGEFGGLGIEVGMEDGFVKVVAPIEDSPAYEVGLKAGDLIMKLDDKAVKGMSLNDAVKIMRGKPGTKIDLVVLRKKAPEPLNFTITRAIIKSKSVKYELKEDGFAYARVTQFQEHTASDLAKAIIDMHEKNKGEFKGFVLDLRNDPGGLLNGAVGVSAAFLPKDALVVYTEGRAADSKMRLTVNPTNYAHGGIKNDFIRDIPEDVKTVPMVVLINAGSASASEIVAGALQDHKRATVMGVKSFGKGSVQTIMPVNNGAAIKLTTARYFTPNGRSIQAKGIVPDYIVEDGSDQSHRLHEADLSGHLSNPKDADGSMKKADKKVNKPKLDKKAANKKMQEKRYAETRGPIKPASKEDFQFQQALNFLQGKPVIKAALKTEETTPKKAVENKSDRKQDQ